MLVPPQRPTSPQPGSPVALVAPAGPVSREGITRAVARVRDLGFTPILGKHAHGRYGYLSGTDEERTEDLNRALHDPENSAIWCLRGGYGTLRILDRIDWLALSRRPRPLIGFSDNTALHLVALRHGVVTFHGPHAASPDFSEFAKASLLRALSSTAPDGPLPFPGPPEVTTIRGGTAEGPLVGGNLALIAATLGTSASIRARGSILFLEEVGEPAYRIDRLLSQLRLAGVFDDIAGLAVGAITACADAGLDGIPDVVEIIADRLNGIDVPVSVGLPFGHVPDSWTLPVGIAARLDAGAGTLRILDAATV